MEGFIIIDKPRGVTSFAMVKLLRRLTGVRRVGHAGTLDPLATGVLPIAVGQAARFIEYTDDAPKAYEAAIRLGIATDTYDADGRVTAETAAAHITGADIESALIPFVGEIEQAPPAYSAIKVAGQPMYRRARAGESVDLSPRRVRIDRITLEGFADGIARITVECGKGTYIRSVAHDVGSALGVGAHLVELRRTASGGFTLAHAHTVDQIESAARHGALESLLLAVDRAVERCPAAILSDARARDVTHGRTVTFPGASGASIVRAYSVRGRFLGVLEPGGAGSWLPRKVRSGADSA
jgi:tRNA pseudouridine55 synthase